MNLRKTATTTPSVAGVSVLLLQLLSILQIPVGTNGNVLSKIPSCEGGCYCLGGEGDCPPKPTLTDSMLPMYRALTHANPMVVSCDPFQASICVSTLEEGEACVVELIAPNSTSGSSCPTGYSYQLTTVPSLENATADDQYITHTGACGACSSLQDLALMIEYPNLPYQAQRCFFRSSAMKYIETAAIPCYEEIGFTTACSAALSYHQKSIIDRECGFECSAWGYDGDLGQLSCSDKSGCLSCADNLGITARLELVAGRTFANSGYPSQKAQQCSDVAPLDVIGGSDVCSLAPLLQSPTEVPSTAPSDAPVVQTMSPTKAPVAQLPTEAPVQLGTAVPTGTPTISPVEPTDSPIDEVTAAPIEVTAAPIEVTAQPVSPITTVPSVTPVPSPATDLLFQQCLSSAAIEVRVGSMSGGGVVCDCSEAETGETNRPRCFTSPDRNESDQCAIQNDSCEIDEDCCGNGIRSCRQSQCRSSGQGANTSSRNRLRLSGSLGGAARNDRNNPNSRRDFDRLRRRA